MAQTDDIPRFRGEEGVEEAGRWLENFIASTGSFSDSGIFRFIQTRFPVESPSRVWFDKLDEAATTSWKVFESRFRDRWVANHESEEWKRFKQHHLTEDMIFKDGSNHQTAQEIISVWADDHLVWGKSLDSTDQVLIDATKRLLPPFIQAYLEAFIGVDFQGFEGLCQTVKGIPLQVINLEFIRRRISSDDWRSNMEKRIVEISAKVDRLITNTGRGSIHGGSVPCLSSYVDAESRPNSHTNSYNDPSTTSVPWEACSALTSVPSETGASHISSAPSTPTAEPLNLSSALDGSRVHEQTLLSHIPLYGIPSTWRKPVCLKSRDELINISQQAIDFIQSYGQPFTLKVCHNRNFLVAVSSRDRLSQSQRYKSTWAFKENGNDELYDSLMNGLVHIHRYYAYQSHHDMSKAVQHWSEHAESNDPTKNVLKPNSVMIKISGSDCYFRLDSSGVPQLVGGVFAPNPDKHNVSISSIKTVQLMILSSYLTECTGDKKYLEIALLTANCIKTWMVDSGTSLIKDCLIDALSAKESDGAVPSCHLTGLAIEGFTVLACLTRDNGWRSLAIDMARLAMLFSEWHTPDGILNLCSDRAASDDTHVRTFKGMLNRGLMVAYERNRSNEPFCTLVRSYVNVQFNALYELSRVQSSYGVDWRGPYVGPHGHAQVPALDTLVAAIGVNDV